MEIELKLLLEDVDAWQTLSASLCAHGQPLEHRQLNLYLDTEDRLLQGNKVMVRVRLQGQQAIVTCKSRAHIVDGVMRAGEWEAVLEVEAAARWRDASGRSSRLSQLPIAEAIRRALPGPDTDPLLQVQATMSNHRQSWAIAPARLGWPTAVVGRAAINLELDRATLPGGIERFELEVEHPGAGGLAPYIRTLLTGLGLTAKLATESKYAQVLRLLDDEISRRG